MANPPKITEFFLNTATSKTTNQGVDMDIKLDLDMDLDNNRVSDMNWECTPTLTGSQLARLDRMKERIRKARAVSVQRGISSKEGEEGSY